MLGKINEVITVVNNVRTTVRNIATYVGVRTSTDPTTITGRLNRLEANTGTSILDDDGKIKQEFLPTGGDTWQGDNEEWSADRSTTTIQTKEWK